MATYTIRYADRASAAKAALPAARRASLEALEKRLERNPFEPGESNKDNSWRAKFTGGQIIYIVSNTHVMVNVIDVISP